MYNMYVHTTYYICTLSSIQEKGVVSDVIGPQPRQATSLIGQSSVYKPAVSQPLYLSTQLRLAASATHAPHEALVTMSATY